MSKTVKANFVTTSDVASDVNDLCDVKADKCKIESDTQSSDVSQSLECEVKMDGYFELPIHWKDRDVTFLNSVSQATSVPKATHSTSNECSQTEKYDVEIQKLCDVNDCLVPLPTPKENVSAIQGDRVHEVCESLQVPSSNALGVKCNVQNDEFDCDVNVSLKGFANERNMLNGLQFMPDSSRFVDSVEVLGRHFDPDDPPDFDSNGLAASAFDVETWCPAI